MPLILIQYNVHTVLLDGNKVGGVQTVNVTKSFDSTSIVGKGNPTTVKNFYKKPNLNISFTKFISDDYSSALSGFNIRNKIYLTPPETHEIKIGVIGGGGYKFVDTVFAGVTYTFTNQGFFTEELNYIGHVSEAIASVSAPAVQEGIVKRRQDFDKNVARPAELTSSTLLSVQASLNINYGEVPSYGRFYTARNKYITYPVDISCAYEILDREYSQSRVDYSTESIGGVNYNLINDEVTYRTISIGGVPTIDLGSKNFLANIERNGGDAGNSDYSILKFTYKNNDNSFTVS
jgi:hypothetical protein